MPSNNKNQLVEVTPSVAVLLEASFLLYRQMLRIELDSSMPVSQDIDPSQTVSVVLVPKLQSPRFGWGFSSSSPSLLSSALPALLGSLQQVSQLNWPRYVKQRSQLDVLAAATTKKKLLILLASRSHPSMYFCQALAKIRQLTAHGTWMYLRRFA